MVLIRREFGGGESGSDREFGGGGGESGAGREFGGGESGLDRVVVGERRTEARVNFLDLSLSRSGNKPLFIALSAIALAGGAFLFSLPHFVSGPYQVDDARVSVPGG